MHQKLSNYTLHKAAYDGICAETIQTTMRVWQETEIASSLVAGFAEASWASWWKIHESRFK